jgi:hypothetical protein
MYSLSSSLSLSTFWTGILVLLTANIVHAQSEIFCNKNYTNNTIALEMQNHGACPQANPAADKITAIQNNLKVNQQAVNSAGNAILGLVSLFGQNSSGDAPSQPDPAELAAARAARAQAQAATRQQQLNASAADVLNQTNSLMASMNGPTGTSTDPNSTAALSFLLGGNQPSNTSTAAISSILGDNPPASTGSANSTATIAGLLGSPSTPSRPGPLNLAIQNPQFAAAFAQSQNPPPDPTRVANLGDDLLDDKPVDPTWNDLVQGMKDTTQKWTNAAGDLLHSHPLDSLAQSFGITQNPNADAFDAGVHDCGVGMMAVALPHPAGGDAAAMACYNASSRAGLNVLQMATD